MDKVQYKINNMLQILKNMVKRFPVTIVLIFVVSIIYAFCLDGKYLSNEIVNKIMQFSVIFGSSTYLFESITKKNDKKNIFIYILFFILSIMLVFLLNIEKDLFGINNLVFKNYIIRFTICYIISMLILSIYILFKKSKTSFEEYIVKVATNIFKSSIIFGILCIGFAIVSSIFVFLILNGKDYILVLKLEVILLGFYYLPKILYSFYDTECEIGNFIKIIIKYVLNLLVIIAFVIIYLYIGKILITRNMPSNQIFRIIAALFIVSFPICTMSSYFKDNSIIFKINKLLPILFITFIILQIYTIGLRIVSNGITEARYLCIMLIIFEIIYIIMYLKYKNKIENILLVFIICVIIALIAPFINMYNISKMSQYNNLKIYKEKSNYTSEEKVKIRGAYYYLKDSINGDKLIDEILTKEDIENIINYENDLSNIKYISSNVNLGGIDIKDYNKLYSVEAHIHMDETISFEKAFKGTEFKTSDNGMYFYIDMTNIISNCLNNGNSINEYLDENHRFIIDENTCIVIKYLSIAYDEYNNNIRNYSIDGYILKK